MKGLRLKLLLLLSAVVAAGCTTVGDAVSGGDRVTFTWNSTEPTSGTMRATLSDGTAYSGQFYEVTDDVDSIGPIWNHWYSGWHDASSLDDAATVDIATHYSGRVIANLDGPNGGHMHCSFALVRPRDGMSGGGSGQCQMSDGSTLNATFPTGSMGSEHLTEQFTDTKGPKS